MPDVTPAKCGISEETAPVVEFLPATRQQQEVMDDALCILAAWLIQAHRRRDSAAPIATGHEKGSGEGLDFEGDLSPQVGAG